MMDELLLNPGQLYLIGLVATLIAQIIKVVWNRLGKEISKVWITIIAFVVAVGLSAIWFRPVLPPIGDPMAYAIALISAATSVLGAAVAIYNVILEKLLQLIDTKFGLLLEP